MQNMIFSEYATGLSPFLSFGKSEYDFFTEFSTIKQNFIEYLIAHAKERQVIIVEQSKRMSFTPGYSGEKSVHMIRFSGNKHKLTRDILHVYGKIITGDTLDVFVCHFPSRYGGEKESEKDRFDAARTLRGSSDSLLLIREKPQILIMGDFNDTPQDRSISEIFAAQAFPENTQITDSTSCTYYNLFASPHITQFPGSHKYQGEWSQLDQIIVNRDLITQESSMHIIPESIHIFAPDFLLTKDKTWRGVRPFRTYYGFKYEGGFSDHLPLTVDFLIRSQIKR